MLTEEEKKNRARELAHNLLLQCSDKEMLKYIVNELNFKINETH